MIARFARFISPFAPDRRARANAGALPSLRDDTATLPPEQVRQLTARGMVFLTESVIVSGAFGTVIADSFQEAVRIARGSRVLGTMTPRFAE